MQLFYKPLSVMQRPQQRRRLVNWLGIAGDGGIIVGDLKTAGDGSIMDELGIADYLNIEDVAMIEKPMRFADGFNDAGIGRIVVYYLREASGK